MNNTFNLNRFLLLFKKHTIEHAKTYLLSAAVLTGILMLIMGFISYTDHGYINIQTQSLIFMWVLPAVGCIFTSLSFAALGDKKQAIALLTLPASHFEKYLVAWLYTFVIFQLVFIGSFYLVDIIVISCGKPPIGTNNQLINVFSYPERAGDFFYPFIIYSLLHAITFCGAVFFEKMHFIKTSFVFFIALIVFGVISAQLQHLIISKNISVMAPVGSINYREENRFWHILAPQSIEIVGKITMALFVTVLWASTFFRLKEKEV